MVKEKVNNVLNSVLKEIRPEPEMDSKVASFINRLRIILKKAKLPVKVIVGGSFAKGTYLKDNYDCDIFVQFPERSDNEKISSLLYNAIKKSYKKVEVVHGSRDYYKIEEGIVFEIVPILAAKDPKKVLNVTDMSPDHVIWAKKYLDKKPKLRDEILLSKAFCKAHRIYGAESYIGGFSGHVIDILIVKYGSFLNLLKSALKWEEKEIIDVEKAYKTKQLAMMGINQSKILSPLVVVDPILPQRNAAAALTKEKYDCFRKFAKEFLKKSSKESFGKKPITPKTVLEDASIKNPKLLVLTAIRLDGKDDIVGAKLLKALEYLEALFEKNDFDVLYKTWEWDFKKDATFYFIFENRELSKEKELPGPLVFQKVHADAFRKKHKAVRLVGKKYVAVEKREFRKPEGFITSLLAKKSRDRDYLMEKVKKISLTGVTSP